MIMKEFQQVPKKYRPIPFWSWNDQLKPEETRRQIELMDQAGMGGYFMHARGGLATEYMGPEWFSNVAAGVEEGKQRGMGAWAYDENGWPSGFGNGIVNGKGVQYQQKYLRMELGEKQTERTVCNQNGYHFYYDVNEFYVDVLNPEATDCFIQEIYAPYYEKFGTEFEGFFTDEPQISRNGIPWSFLLPGEYQQSYGEALLPRLRELFEPVGAYQDTRVKFWKLVTELFSKNYMKKLCDWCGERGLGFTGHMVLEEDLEMQLTSNGAVMPHYEYFTMPGIDWLGRNVFDCLTPLQVGSVAQQLGKKQVLAEDFALCGHNVGFEALRRILEWQMVRGVTLVCPHLEGYTLRGIRKRDYPPAMYYQQPWWAEYGIFTEAMSRIGMALTEGKAEFDTLLLHPQTSAWALFDDGAKEGLAELHEDFLETIRVLERKHILFHLGDEILMERHARVEGGALIIGEQTYRSVVLPRHLCLLPNTQRLLEEYQANGGVVTNAENLEENPVTDNGCLTYTKRVYPEFDLHYFVNTTEQPQQARIWVGSQWMDIKTAALHPFEGYKQFAPFDSLIVLDYRDEAQASVQTEIPALKPLELDGEWKVAASDLNAMTLDFCTYYFDGQLQEENGYVLNIQNRAIKENRELDIRCVYSVHCTYVPEALYLVCETPELFEIIINGRPLEQKDCGYYRDIAFRKLDISGYFHEGVNTIELNIHFWQSPQVYESIRKGLIFESEKNKLTYDVEIEPIYLLGAFGVKGNGPIAPLERDALRFAGSFEITPPAERVCLQNLEQQGYLFFAGELALEKEFELKDENYKLSFEKKGINSVQVFVNGEKADTLIWNPWETDLSPYLKKGKNLVKLVLHNNLRNLLGPHHLKAGESYEAGPHSFFCEPCIWNPEADRFWEERYCFVETGLWEKDKK